VFDDEESHTRLVRGVAAAKSNSREEARFFLNRALEGDLSVSDRIQAWRYLARLADDPKQQRIYLERLLAADPTDGAAQRDLAVLNGLLDPREIIDPEKPATAASAPPGPARARSFVCPRCGSGRVVFTPDGRSLECEHCHFTQPVGDPEPNREIEGRPFVATMWTARGHRTPVATQSFTCGSCGAAVLLAAGQLSLVCPYCAGVYTIETPEIRELLAPDAIIPFAVTEADATERVRRSIRDRHDDTRIDRVRGMFVPIWVFSFIGEVAWTGTIHEKTFGYETQEPASGAHAIIQHVVRVPGVRRPPEPVDAFLHEVELTGLSPFDARLLAAWPALAYDISLENASAAARSVAVRQLRTEVLENLDGDVHDVSMEFNRMAVDSFTLALIPIWVVELLRGDSRVPVLVSGQTGALAAESPRQGV
jgi:predicted RNA-binding Zn-ribbon protein involved in translation (DUF1610 family)